MEYHEVLLAYQVAFMEYHEALLNNRKLDGIPSSFYGKKPFTPYEKRHGIQRKGSNMERQEAFIEYPRSNSGTPDILYGSPRS